VSLSTAITDRLFERLALCYGRAFLDPHTGQDVAAVKTSWSHELGAYDNRLHAIAWALANLPERAPNVIQFRNLCRAAPAPAPPALPDVENDRARLAAELARLADIRTRVLGSAPTVSTSPRAWAQKLKDRIDRGEIVPTLTQRKMMQSVLDAAVLYQSPVVDDWSGNPPHAATSPEPAPSIARETQTV
jgi:hypothetical protein